MQITNIEEARRVWLKAVRDNCDDFFRSNPRCLILHYEGRLDPIIVQRISGLISMGAKVDVLYYDTQVGRTKVRLIEPEGLQPPAQVIAYYKK